MDYHLYFHDDFDGATSGAVLLDFFRRNGDSITSYTPLNFSPTFKAAWPGYDLREPSVIVDFLYHPRATWWFDHHTTSFIDFAWQADFIPDAKHIFDATYPSCCGLVMEHLAREFDYQAPAHLRELARYADMLDTAGYQNVNEALDFETPARRLALLLSATFDDHDQVREDIIKILSRSGIEAVTSKEPYSLAINALLQQIQRAHQECQSFTRLEGTVAIVDKTNIKYYVPRFLEYALYSQAQYSVSIKKSDGDYYIVNVGRNPWLAADTTAPHLGQFLSQYGGGGHARVGGAEATTTERAWQIVHETVQYLNHGR